MSDEYTLAVASLLVALFLVALTVSHAVTVMIVAIFR